MGNFLRKLTHAAAGVDPVTMAQCSSAEKTKYSILGTLVYIPLVTGIVAMTFASSYFTHNVLLIAAVCLVWGGVVFVIERSLIAGLRPHTMSWVVLVRIILAVAMSCIITELLMIFFFRADINTRIAEKNSAQTEALFAEGDARVEGLKADLAHHKQLLDEKEKAYLDEIDGLNGTGLHGYGPSAKAKEEALLLERAFYEEAKRSLDEEIAAASQRRDDSVERLEGGRNQGLLQSIVALYELSAEERHVSWALWVAHIFFLCVELMPLFIKLSFPGNQYYDIMDLTDNQKLEALRATMNETRHLMQLTSQCEIAQQEVALKNKMIRLQLQQETDKTIAEARAAYDTARMLDDLENQNRVSEQRAARLKQLNEEIFERYIGRRNTQPAAG